MALPVFTWKPFTMPKVQDNFAVLTSTFENGQVQKRFKHRNPTVWILSFQTSFAEMLEIRQFYNDRKGSFEAFEWTEPYTKTVKTVRFKDDNLDIESEWGFNGIFEVTFEEVL